MRLEKMEYAAFKNLIWEILLEFAENFSELKRGRSQLRAKEYRLVSKALRPLPEKWHGLTDNDQIYRQRYLDLIVNEESRERFRTRSQIIREIREFFWRSRFFGDGNPHVTGSFWWCGCSSIQNAFQCVGL